VVRTLVLGLGNILLGDEGVGVRVAQALVTESLPPDVTVLDAGTAILDALPAIEEADRLIVVDAVKADGAPGSVYRIPFDEMARPAVIGSLHGFDLSRVLALAGRVAPVDVVVIGVEPQVIEWSLSLSPGVRDAVPAALQAVREELGEKPGSQL
jgi:hydrogenase maturation protease